MLRRDTYRSRALALLLFFIFLVLPACGTGLAGGDRADTPRAEKTRAQAGTTVVEAVRPEDVLSEKELTGAPEFRDWNDEGGKVPKVASTSDSSVGAIPAVKPFNFGQNPGGPEDKTLYLTVPKLDIYDVPAFDAVTEEKLKESVIHVPPTGFPWQKGANTYIAGHRIGYEGTGSYRIFYDLDLLAEGDEIVLTDAAGSEYYYRVTRQEVVGPDNIEVMEPVDGKSIVTLQTCTLPEYSERLVVQGELIEKNA